ncbi:hypothetical protein B0T17DRAFT_588063 [Bombardia bombarda]|uniref:Uncharacterized protein n=1 Tax=Bombardia bombarda TaxID=252184 RepID=A0AA40CG87_9PEZI|nr:hypothetical protein B0T17DRAFT_588063 [Bombardia bombarda]
MATELPKERSDEATVTSEAEPTIKIDTTSQNVDLDQPHVNGDSASPATDEIENKHISDIVDDLVNSSEVSISGGSDNEATKTSESSLKDDEKGHGRTSSTVKKPISFKAINVNKTFLTTKAAAPSAPSRPSDKASTVAGSASSASGSLTASRPRLVAKTGTGLVTKSSSGANGGKAGSAPDPSVVWNKNKPVPVPEPKKYTDEELKKYGIHMATRLAPDDTTKGHANWADIDDDDEDWAPETITWTDGTKVAIPHTEEHPPAPEPQPQPPAAPEPAPRPVGKEAPIVEKPISPIPVPSPIVKPYVLGSGKGLVLKGATEKPTLVAKPPTLPTPVKSPWAPIPKVDKASPIVMDLPNNTGAKYTPRNAHIPSHNTGPPPKEIAADDFSRAPWRDGAASGNRELFNSQSGRYEPVQDRRSSLRPDPQHGRQPALLQRSLHEQQGPAEPSAAFQTSRSSEQHASYGRRRGSSNASGGSGNYLQRMKGYDQPLPSPELLIARRESMTGGSDGPASPRNFSPSGSRHSQGWQARASPVSVHASPYQQNAQLADGRGIIPPVHPPPVPITEEDYELQKRLMRERRELAMKRRLEEEAREEKERKERIRLKLEALGPPLESKSAKKAALKDQPTTPTPTQIQPRENSTSQRSDQADGQKADSTQAATSEASQKAASLSSEADAQPLPSPDTVESSSEPQGSTHSHPWPSTAKQPPRYPVASWGTQPSAAANNVWGAPNNDRSLGNGTFTVVSDLGPSKVPNKAGPGPIAPPNSTRSALASPTDAPGSITSRQPPIAPPKQTSRVEQASTTGTGSNEREAKQNAWASAVRLNDDAFREALNAQYSERERRLKKEGRSLTDIQPAIKDTWRPTKVDETGSRTEAARKQALEIGKENPWAAGSETKPSPSQKGPSNSSANSSEYGQRTQGTAPIRDSTSTSIPGSASGVPPSPSPPPPDMVGHPAFDGDVTHPQVSLPRPQPVVRLPPTTTTTDAGPMALAAPGSSKHQGPSFAWATTGAYKEHEGAPVPGSASRTSQPKPDSAWQSRIDTLLNRGKPYSPPNPPAWILSIASSSEPDSSTTSKDMAEECFEEQEMGSLPPVRLPNKTPDHAWNPTPAPKALPRKLFTTVSSAEAITFPPDMSGSGPVWRVSLPGHDSKAIVVPYGRSRSNPRRGGARGGRQHPPTAPHRQGKGRDASSSYSTDQQGSGASGSNNLAPQSRPSRGNYRGRDSWSRNVSAPIQT